MLNMINFSSTAEEMVRNSKGYRTELFGGSEVTKLEDIIEHDVCSLGNTDVIEHFQNHYNLLTDYLLVKEAVVGLKKKTKCRDELETMVKEAQLNCYQENIKHIIEDIRIFIEEKISASKEDKLFALWLTDKETVKNIYLKGFCEKEDYEDNIDCYKLIDINDYIIIADLGDEGSLFVFKETQHSISEDEEQATIKTRENIDMLRDLVNTFMVKTKQENVFASLYGSSDEEYITYFDRLEELKVMKNIIDNTFREVDFLSKHICDFSNNDVCIVCGKDGRA